MRIQSSIQTQFTAQCKLYCIAQFIVHLQCSIFNSMFNLQFNSISIFNSLPIHAHSIQYADSNSSLNVQTILYRSIQHSIHRSIQFQFMHIQSSIQTILHRSIHAYSIHRSTHRSIHRSTHHSIHAHSNVMHLQFQSPIQFQLHRLVFNIQT